MIAIPTPSPASMLERWSRVGQPVARRTHNADMKTVDRRMSSHSDGIAKPFWSTEGAFLRFTTGRFRSGAATFGSGAGAAAGCCSAAAAGAGRAAGAAAPGGGDTAG